MSQIGDAIKNDNPDQQANFLAANMILPEMAAIRLNALGGQVGVEGIKHIEEQMQAQFKVLGPTLDPQVYAKALQIMDQKIDMAVSVANKEGLTGSVGPEQVEQSRIASQQQSGKAESMVFVTLPDGRTGQIPQSSVAELQQRIPGTKVMQ